MEYREENSQVLNSRMMIRVQKVRSEPEVTMKMYLDMYRKPRKTLDFE